jgi:selenide,water dikinase
MGTPVLKLTSMAKAAGCAAKLNPAILENVLRTLPRQLDPNVLVGFETNDDAGILKISEDLALVQTVDFFTPIVDDAHLFGQIAAANALSDIYAMGGLPVSALSVVGFPEQADPGILEQIIRGGLSKMQEAGCSVIGGHSIRTEDMLFGYAVTGTVHPQKFWRNVGARPGDVLIFTKPLGTGVITTALKKDKATPQSLEAAIGAMTTLNRAAAAAFMELIETVRSSHTTKPALEPAYVHAPQGNESSLGNDSAIHAVTDVTGFGVLGHAREMALGNPVRGIAATSLLLEHSAFSYLPGAVEASRDGHLSGGLKNNRAFVAECAAFADNVPQEFRDLLFDPQTSGGLLAAVAAEFAEECVAVLARHGVVGHQVGRVVEKRSPLLFVS